MVDLRTGPMVVGIVVLVYPGISLATLAVVLGFWLLVFGIMEIGWRSGSARPARPLPASRPPPSPTAHC